MNTKPLITLGEDARGAFAAIAVWPAQPCGCGRMAAIHINRGGRTACTECDARAAAEVKP